MNDPGPEMAIEAIGLTRRFGDLTAVDQLSLDVVTGQIFGLVGPDGAGKTTTLRMLAGLLRPTDGEARIAGYNARTESGQVKDRLAYMSQRFGLYGDLSVDENIRFYADLYGVPATERSDRVNELLTFSNLHPFRTRLAGALSGGMKQKLQLACALIHTPRVLLLDEPTNGVDPVSRRDFWKILYQLLNQGTTILVATAYLDEAERCNRVGLLSQGKLLVSGSPAEVKQSMPDHILSIHSSRARQVRQVIQSRLEYLPCNAFGDRVHVVCPDVTETRNRIQHILTEAGIDVEGITEEPANLEDVFVHLLGEPMPEQKPSRLSLPVEHLPDRSGSPDQPKPTVVALTRLTRRFKQFVAVDAISLQVRQGEIFGFLGPNGAGKSTTIRMLCGLLTPSDGTGTVAGYDIRQQPEAIKQHIGYMSQKFSLYEDLTVQENINFYGGVYGLSGTRLADRKAWAIGMSGLSGKSHSITGVLSVGVKQRLALACAVLHAPAIVFLDEPTSGVDPLSRRRFWDMIYGMAEAGVTIFVTTHYMEEAEYCDRIAMIYHGRMIALGTPLELKTNMTDRYILDVQCAKPQEILDAVATLPEVHDAALFGAGLHAVVADSEAAEAAIRNLLKIRGIAVDRLAPVLPGMEDVFVSLIEASIGRTTGTGNRS